MSPGLKRESIWLAIAVLAGLVLLPLAVYYTGTLTLGPYSRGGAGRFLLDFLASLARLEWQALALSIAPVAVLLAWRIGRALRARGADEEDADTPARRGAAVRREPTL